MEYEIKLNDDEWHWILNALEYFKNKNLKKSLKTLKKAKYQNMSGLFVNEEFFNKYIKEQIKDLEKQIEQIEMTYEKIAEEM